MKRILCLILAALLALSLLSGCRKTEKTVQPPEPEAAQEPVSADPTTEDPAQMPEPSEPADPEPSDPTEPEEPDPWRALTQAELEELNAALSWEDNGFFVCAYDRPEEIDWNQVCYNGAGIDQELTEEDYAHYEEALGELYTDLTVIRRTDLEQFVLEKTGTSYALARKPLGLSWFTEDNETYVHQHGDTNYQPIQFAEGYVNGNLYRLRYQMSDWQNWEFDRTYEARVRIQDGAWTFLANYAADAPVPETLLTIRYCQTRKEAAAEGAENFVETDFFDFDEPYGKCWAVLTAQSDNVRFVVDRADTSVPEQLELRIPGNEICSGVLNKGESIAVYVNQPWHANLRVWATLGTLWGEFFFGEDNFLHLPDDALRYVTGHDLTAEGRGCQPQSETQLARFLMDGDWAYLDEETGETLACVRFRDYRTMDIVTKDQYYDIFMSYEHLDAEETAAPDLLQLDCYPYSEADWSILPEQFESGELGSYLVSAAQLDGEQILYLTQETSDDAALSWLMPAAIQKTTFVLHRYRGTAEFEPQG